MANQEAMRGRAEEMLNQMMAEAAKPSIRSIKGPTIPQIADKITEFALQELASRDARIARLIRQRCALESRLQQISDVLKEHKIEREQENWEALKEQP